MKNGKAETEYHVPLSDEGHPQGNQARVKQIVEEGLKLFESLGLGGMNTRGMGRLKVLNLNTGGASNG